MLDLRLLISQSKGKESLSPINRSGFIFIFFKCFIPPSAAIISFDWATIFLSSFLGIFNSPLQNMLAKRVFLLLISCVFDIFLENKLFILVFFFFAF